MYVPMRLPQPNTVVLVDKGFSALSTYFVVVNLFAERWGAGDFLAPGLPRLDPTLS